MDDSVAQDQCSVCKDWPKAERAELRDEYFSVDFNRIPLEGVCLECQFTFWANTLVPCERTED
jgi:hypothetical protein